MLCSLLVDILALVLELGDSEQQQMLPCLLSYNMRHTLCLV